ncbi:MAG: hypothetical protein ACE5LG_08235 [Anaerolineae bacterium]
MADALSRLWRRVDPYLILLLLFSLFAIAPLFQPGYFWGAHDARHSVYFLFEFDRSIQDGVWYPRWSPDFAFGYGYPFFNIYGPLAFYMGEAFHLLGLGFVSAVKSVFAFSFLLSGVTMFLFVRRFMGSRAGLLAGLVYIYIPYHIVDVYVRASLAESLALAFLPLNLWLFYETVAAPRLAAVLGAGLSYAGLMLTHNGLTLLFSPLLGIYLIFLVFSRALAGRKRGLSGGLPEVTKVLVRSSLPPILGLLLGLGLSAIFWLPMALEFNYVRLDQWMGGYYGYRDHFVYLFQLFSPFWGYGLSEPGLEDGFPFQLGAIPVVFGFLSLVALRRIERGELRRLLLFFQATTVVIIFLMLPASIPLWEVLRLVTFAQFPWRLLTLAVVALSFLAGSILVGADSSSQGVSPLAVVALAVLVILGSYPYLMPQIVEPAEGPVSLQGLMQFQRSAGEMTGSTTWVHEIPTWSPMAQYMVSEDKPITTKVDYESLPKRAERIIVGTKGYGTTFEKVIFRARKEGRITFNTFYYPGWHAYLLESEEGPIERELKIVPHGTWGKITVTVPEGDHYLLLRFEDTPVRVVGKYVTALSVLVMFAALGWKARGRAFSFR